VWFGKEVSFLSDESAVSISGVSMEHWRKRYWHRKPSDILTQTCPRATFSTTNLWILTCVFAVSGRRLTTWAMARHSVVAKYKSLPSSYSLFGTNSYCRSGLTVLMVAESYLPSLGGICCLGSRPFTTTVPTQDSASRRDADIQVLSRVRTSGDT